MKKEDVIQSILGSRYQLPPSSPTAEAFAPTNIALCKYWGKRNHEINLPITSSLSVSLPGKGANVTLTVQDTMEISLNGKLLSNEHPFSQRLIQFLQLFHPNIAYQITIETNVPIGAGLASSACGFASIVKALNQLYGWQLADRELSILARLGSGSACRSLWEGFVVWHAGHDETGSDSHGELLPIQWPELRIGLLIVDQTEKHISSRDAMECTVKTSPLYTAWPNKVASDLPVMLNALQEKNFSLLGETAESNALTMHALMLSAVPAISYTTPETIKMMQTIWKYREQGLPLYFTQDAGPNLKLLFLEKDQETVFSLFKGVE